MSLHQERRPYFSATNGRRYQMYCGICGYPLYEEWYTETSWLDDILVLPVVTEQFAAIPVKYVDELRLPDIAYNAWEDGEMSKAAIPVHKTCLDIADSMAKTTREKPLSIGGPPKSLLDVSNVLRARLMNYVEGNSGSTLLNKITEPSWYGGLRKNMHHQEWYSESMDDEVWLEDPTRVQFNTIPRRS